MGGGGNDGANCTGGGGQNNRCYWLFDLAVDDEERHNIYEEHLGEGGVVEAMTSMLESWAAVSVTCEEAQTCGPADPAATPIFREQGYYVPWMNVPV